MWYGKGHNKKYRTENNQGTLIQQQGGFRLEISALQEMTDCLDLNTTVFQMQ